MKRYSVNHLTKMTIKDFKSKPQKVITGHLKGRETLQSIFKSILIFHEEFVHLTERKPNFSFVLAYF